jgi:hypothetical protein
MSSFTRIKENVSTQSATLFSLLEERYLSTAGASIYASHNDDVGPKVASDLWARLHTIMEAEDDKNCRT